ncbi:MAG: response regulator [Calditrichaeota bacterium]|nr:response regulator [Candidatus Cloacimonadota bacterium]MCA9785294.1 response regulator [Candidatus Cloacimonadota bacterium]MCB1046855.1 response regulator [Calditrichota bacterium]MCB9474418.1 response regulator [Candidatus Delongbacteria bacterium]
MRTEKVLIVTQNKNLANQARMLLRESGITFVTVIDTPARALSALWGDTPDICLLDLGNQKDGMLDILPVILGSGKPLATLGAICYSAHREREEHEWREECALVKGLGVTHCLPADTPPSELQKLLKQLLGAGEGVKVPDSSKKLRMLLFLNDRTRSHTFHEQLQGHPVDVDDAIEVDALCRAFLDNTPDLVLIDPRGLGANLTTIGNVARHFSKTRIYFIVPPEASIAWTARAQDFVTRVIEYPEDKAGFRKITALLLDVAQEAAPEPPTEPVEVPPEPPRPKRILVVDDDNAVRSMMIEFLKHFGYETMEAEDGRDALDQIRNERPDLLISDIYMPRMNGFQLFMEVRNNWPDLPVILITGYNSAAKDMASYSIHDAEFLEKPFELATVEAMVRAKLNRVAS